MSLFEKGVVDPVSEINRQKSGASGPTCWCAQSSKGAGVEQRVLQALMAKRFPKIVAQLERADSSVEVGTVTVCRS